MAKSPGQENNELLDESIKLSDNHASKPDNKRETLGDSSETAEPNPETSGHNLETSGHGPATADEASTARAGGPADRVAGLPAIFADKYKVIEKIGEGGMSTVYKVQHILMNKTLALKVLHQVKEESVLRFQQEAKASSLLEHPNIVRVHDFGIADGFPYMTMDYLDGLPLSDFSKAAGSLSLERMTRIFGQICSALAHAHDHGVIHRDLKPSNIIVRTLEDGFEQAIVVDYGIAKITSDVDNQQSHNLTRTGDVFGTPLYMSPEQCQGQNVDARSDIYSLGCVMYETIAGKPPFQGSSTYQIIHRQITEAPPPFPEAVRKKKQGRRLEAVVLKSMAKSPGDRQQHVLELSSQLKSIEIGRGGSFSDLKALAQIISGRMKAAERRSVVLKFLLNASTLLSIIVSVVLLTVPEPIKSAKKEIERNNEIIKDVRQCFSHEELVLNMTQARAMGFGLLKSLRGLCKDNPRQKIASANLTRSVRAALNRTASLKPQMAKKFAQGVGLDGLPGLLDQAEENISFVLGAWIKANTDGTDLIIISDKNIEQSKQCIQDCSLVLTISWTLGTALLLSMPVLTWNRFVDLRAARLKMASQEGKPGSR